MFKIIQAVRRAADKVRNEGEKWSEKWAEMGRDEGEKW